MAEHHGAAARRRTTGRADRSRHFTRSLTCVVQSAAFGSGVHVTRQSRAPPTVSPHSRGPRRDTQTHGNGCDDSTAFAAAAGVKAFESLRVRRTSAGGLLTTTASSLLGGRFFPLAAGIENCSKGGHVPRCPRPFAEARPRSPPRCLLPVAGSKAGGGSSTPACRADARALPRERVRIRTVPT